ncbi:MAG: hypothetical protein KDJ29_03755, partial [Hyphomicrobiales bacterium]|nr:hypothetical protein [Hyphomicrobiales bacterium]
DRAVRPEADFRKLPGVLTRGPEKPHLPAANGIQAAQTHPLGALLDEPGGLFPRGKLSLDPAPELLLKRQ